MTSSTATALQAQHAITRVVDLATQPVPDDPVEALTHHATKMRAWHQAQNMAATMRIAEKRNAGRIIAEHDITTDLLTPAEHDQARQLSLITDEQLADIAGTVIAEGGDLSERMVRGMLPKGTPRARKAAQTNTIDEWITPSITTELAAQVTSAATTKAATVCQRSLNAALASIDNKKYAFAFAKYRGITNDGVAEPWTFEQIGQALGATREYAEICYRRGAEHVYRALARSLLHELEAILEDATTNDELPW
jgi:hypothetical protein